MTGRRATTKPPREALLGYFSKLNDEGRARALVYMRDLAETERYTTREKRDPAQVLELSKRG